MYVPYNYCSMCATGIYKDVCMFDWCSHSKEEPEDVWEQSVKMASSGAAIYETFSGHKDRTYKRLSLICCLVSMLV